MARGDLRGDLTDAQWAVLEPVLPEGAKVGRPLIWPRRQLIDGIRFRVRTGVPWRDVPVEYGPWGRIYDLFRRWRRDGTWHRVLTQLQSQAGAKGGIRWDLSVDSTVCRAHQHAVGASKQGAHRRNHRAECRPSPVITGCDAHLAGYHQAAGGCRAGPEAHADRGDCPGSAATRRNSSPCWSMSAYRGNGAGRSRVRVAVTSTVATALRRRRIRCPQGPAWRRRRAPCPAHP
ncbi:transposase [Streptomyces sp. NPDC001928]|uniref:transposase n=1 Tax=Streptomyces sp. NPDC001928 TaxID=3154404 RepID=UPI0033232B77